MVTWSSISTLLGLLCRLLGEPLQEPLDLAVLLALAVGPFPDHLLLGAHMRDQPLNGLREIGHRRGGGAATAAFLDRDAQLVECGGEVTGGGAVIAVMADRRGEPVLEVGIEA